MIWYRVSGSYHDKIEPVEVEKETDKTLTIQEKEWNGRTTKLRRINKVSSWERFFPTWEEAHAYLLGRAQKEADGLRLRLEQARGRLGNIKGMKKPE